MAGIYIHIPFCKQKCVYCNFYSIPVLEQKETYLRLLLKEIELQKSYLSNERVSTIYFGGGTPSILSVKELDTIFAQLNRFFNIDANAEITLEANPEHLTKEYFSLLKSLNWVNRLSIGLQSFNNKDLKFLNRKHNGWQSSNCVIQAQEHGFNNISIDLIYGIPTSTNETWQHNLEKANELNIQHLSCYALTVEQGTMLDKMIERGISPAVSEKQTIEQFDILLGKIGEYGFMQYEISNFCKPNFESKHNSSYWNGTYYLGLGASAHSFNGVSRQWNFSNIKNYIQAIETKMPFFEKEDLSMEDCYNEYIMTALRTYKGISKSYIEKNFPLYYKALCVSILNYMQDDLVEESDEAFTLTNKGKLFADRIASELFV